MSPLLLIKHVTESKMLLNGLQTHDKKKNKNNNNKFCQTSPDLTQVK